MSWHRRTLLAKCCRALASAPLSGEPARGDLFVAQCLGDRIVPKAFRWRQNFRVHMRSAVTGLSESRPVTARRASCIDRSALPGIGTGCRCGFSLHNAERGAGDVPPGFVPVAITGCGGKLPSREEQAAIEIEVGAVRIRVRGTVDRRALCEVLAAVGTVGR
jgi:hypothetical protein